MNCKGKFITLLMALSLTACDSGLIYMPSGVTFYDGYWHKMVEPAELRVRTLGNLVDAKFMGVEVSIVNHSSLESIGVASVTLETKKGKYAGKVRIGDIDPGHESKGAFFWEFEEPVREILIEPVRLVITIRIGREEKTAEVDFTPIRSKRF